MITLNSMDEVQAFYDDPSRLAELGDIDYKAVATAAITFVREQTTASQLLKMLGVLDEKTYRTLKGFICDLMDDLLQAMGVDASAALDELSGGSGVSIDSAVTSHFFNLVGSD